MTSLLLGCEGRTMLWRTGSQVGQFLLMHWNILELGKQELLTTLQRSKDCCKSQWFVYPVLFVTFQQLYVHTLEKNCWTLVCIVFPMYFLFISTCCFHHKSCVQPLHTSQQEMVWWAKLNFLGLFPRSGEDQWDCKINFLSGFALLMRGWVGNKTKCFPCTFCLHQPAVLIITL